MDGSGEDHILTMLIDRRSSSYLIGRSFHEDVDPGATGSLELSDSNGIISDMNQLEVEPPQKELAPRKTAPPAI